MVNQHQPYAEEFHHDAHVDGLAEFHDRSRAGSLPECLPPLHGDVTRPSDQSSEVYAFAEACAFLEIVRTDDCCTASRIVQFECFVLGHHW